MTGIRAELAIDELADCPVATASVGEDAPIREVRWAATGEETVEQFATTGEPAVDGVESVFEYGERTVYEFGRDAADPCFCEFVESRLGPIADVSAHDGTLRVTVHASDVAALREVVGELTDRFGAVRLEYLVQTRTDEEAGAVVPVDVDRLTDRQREVVETAYEMGYFEYPRGANAKTVAEALDIGPSTFSEHLAVAQSKLLGEVIDRS